MSKPKSKSKPDVQANRLTKEFIYLPVTDDPHDIIQRASPAVTFPEIELFKQTMLKLESQYTPKASPVGMTVDRAYFPVIRRLMHELRWWMENRYPDQYKPCCVEEVSVASMMVDGVGMQLLVLMPNDLNLPKVQMDPTYLGPVLSRAFPIPMEFGTENVFDLVASLNIARHQRLNLMNAT